MVDKVPIKRVWPRWSAEEDRLVGEMTAAGFASESIAALVGRTPSAIQTRRSYLAVTSQFFPPWTALEDRLVAELCPLMRYRDLGILIGRTHHAIRNRTREIGAAVPAKDDGGAWSTGELALLRSHFPELKTRELLAFLPGRSMGAISSMARAEGLCKSENYWLRRQQAPSVQYPPELYELRRLSKKLRKAIADEERRRSSGDAVRRNRSADPEPRGHKP